MPPEPTSSPTASTDSPLGLRVILAGRTGLVADLRRDRNIELIRAAGAHEALGELNDPIDHESPEQALVVVGPDVAATIAGRELLDAVRLVRPGTLCVLATPVPPGGAGADHRFDSVVSQHSSGDDLRRLVRTLKREAMPIVGERLAQAGAAHAGVAEVQQRVLFTGLSGPMLAGSSVAQADVLGYAAASSSPPAGIADAARSDHRASGAAVGVHQADLSPAVPATQDASAERSVVPGLPIVDPARSVAPPRHRPEWVPAAPPALAAHSASGLAPALAPVAALAHQPAHERPLHPRQNKASAAPAIDPSERVRDSTPQRSEQATGSWQGWGEDRAVVAALLRGDDVLTPALALIRARLGRSDVSFSAHGPVHATSPGHVAVPTSLGGVLPELAGTHVTVAHNGRVLGQLGSISLGAARLEPAAVWLGEVLALRDELADVRTSAITDELTGAFNRRYLSRFLAHALADSAQRRCMLSVMIFDIDLFKGYNDRLGHAAGDELLREVVRLLKAMVRPDDRVCRVGGDEFVVVFYEPSGPREAGTRHPDSVERIAQRFQKQIAEHRFPKLGPGLPVRLTVSGGLATFPWDGRTPDELLARADAKLLEAKRQGRNALVIG